MPDVPQTVTSWACGGMQVDRRVAHPGGHQQAQVGQPVEQRRREGRALAHRHDHLGAGQPFGQCDLVGDVLGDRHQLDVGRRPVGARRRHGLVVIQHDTPHGGPLFAARLRAERRPAPRTWGMARTTRRADARRRHDDEMSDPPVVQTASGALRGTRIDTAYCAVHRFAGIPFGVAPVGDRRFRAADPAPPWSGVRPAVDFGPAPGPGDERSVQWLGAGHGGHHGGRGLPDAERLAPGRGVHGSACPSWCGSTAGRSWSGPARRRPTTAPACAPSRTSSSSRSTTGSARSASSTCVRCPTATPPTPTAACTTNCSPCSGCNGTSPTSEVTRRASPCSASRPAPARSCTCSRSRGSSRWCTARSPRVRASTSPRRRASSAVVARAVATKAGASTVAELRRLPVARVLEIQEAGRRRAAVRGRHDGLPSGRRRRVRHGLAVGRDGARCGSRRAVARSATRPTRCACSSIRVPTTSTTMGLTGWVAVVPQPPRSAVTPGAEVAADLVAAYGHALARRSAPPAPIGGPPSRPTGSSANR